MATSQANGSGAGVRPTSTTRPLAHPAAEQLPDHQPLAGAQLELAQVDRAAPQPDAVAIDLAHPSGADEHAPAPHRHHEPVDTRRAAAQVEHHVDHAADIGAVRAHQRQPRQAAHVHDAVRHVHSVDRVDAIVSAGQRRRWAQVAAGLGPRRSHRLPATSRNTATCPYGSWRGSPTNWTPASSIRS